MEPAAQPPRSSARSLTSAAGEPATGAACVLLPFVRGWRAPHPTGALAAAAPTPCASPVAAATRAARATMRSSICAVEWGGGAKGWAARGTRAGACTRLRCGCAPAERGKGIRWHLVAVHARWEAQKAAVTARSAAAHLEPGASVELKKEEWNDQWELGALQRRRGPWGPRARPAARRSAAGSDGTRSPPAVRALSRSPRHVVHQRARHQHCRNRQRAIGGVPSGAPSPAWRRDAGFAPRESSATLLSFQAACRHKPTLPLPAVRPRRGTRPNGGSGLLVRL